jgi:hypothetical protein
MRLRLGTLCLIRIDNPPANDRGCTYSANLHKALTGSLRRLRDDSQELTPEQNK